MRSSDLLLDAFGRIPGQVYETLEGLSADQISARLDPKANSIAWLLWHLSRIADDHIAEVAGVPQLWVSGGWAERWGLPFATEDTGYGHTSKEVAAVTGDPELIRSYFDAVQEMTTQFVRSLSDADLDRIVDDRWDPPVTLGVRLVSVAEHSAQQVAQAAFVKGVLERKATSRRRKKAG